MFLRKAFELSPKQRRLLGIGVNSRRASPFRTTRTTDDSAPVSSSQLRSAEQWKSDRALIQRRIVRSPGPAGTGKESSYNRSGLGSVFRQEALKSINDESSLANTWKSSVSSGGSSSVSGQRHSASSSVNSRVIQKVGRDVFRPSGAWWVGGLRRKSTSNMRVSRSTG